MKNRLMFRVDRHDWTDTLQLYFACSTSDPDMIAVATNITFETVPPESAPPQEAPVSMSRGEAAALLDELWNAGIRPTKVTIGNDEREALKAHIADLQRIIAALLPQRMAA